MTATGYSRGRAARRKGQAFQRRVARILEGAGWQVQQVGSGVAGTDLVAHGPVTLYVETKDQERLKVPEWWRQTVDSCPPGAVPVLALKLPGGTVLWVTSETPA